MSTGPPEASLLLDRIAHSLPAMRASEQAVGGYVLRHPTRVIDLSFREIASGAGVSEPTVARFCAALGFSGYREFKLRLAQSLASGVPFVHGDVAPGDPVAEIGAKVFDRAVNALLAVRNHLDARQVERAVRLLSRARRIEFYGQGNSGIVAQDAEHKFFRLGVATRSCSDPNVHAMTASLLGADGVAVAISASGRTLDILRSVQIARDAGARTIAITVSGSPLAQACDIALHADVPEDFNIYTPMTSRLAHLTIVDLLAVCVAVARGPSLAPRLRRAKEVVAERRSAS
jgi:RpiR family carbohydrate utilization transcriptional regulator